MRRTVEEYLSVNFLEESSEDLEALFRDPFLLAGDQGVLNMAKSQPHQHCWVQISKDLGRFMKGAACKSFSKSQRHTKPYEATYPRTRCCRVYVYIHEESFSNSQRPSMFALKSH